MGTAEIVVVLAIGALGYAALAPLRRAIMRRMLRREPHPPARVIPLVRGSDGVYTPPERRRDGDQR